jgi:plasmid stability protein
MSVSLSIKNVPDELAERLRARAARNRRSLQRELLFILEQAGAERAPPVSVDTAFAATMDRLPAEEVFDRARRLFPSGTPSSVNLIREMRDGRYGVDREPAVRRSKRRTR